VTSAANRHPVVLLGAAASLISVLGFFGVRSDLLEGAGAGTIACDGDQTFQVTGDYGTVPVTVELAEA
jgi:hypothetical protein